MKFSRPSTLLLTFLLLLKPIAFAEEEAPPQVKTEILSLSLFQPVSGLFLFNGEEVVPFKSVPRGFGIPIPYEGPASVPFYRDEKAFLPEAVPTQPDATVTLPLQSDRVLILTGNATSVPLPLKAIPIDTQKIRNGDYLIVNLSRRPVAFVIGGKQIKVAAGKIGFLTDPAWKEGILDLPVYMGYQSEGEMKTYSSVWGHRPTRRNFVFIFDRDQTDAAPELRRIYDTVPQGD
ncbi:hypothetical protein P3T73_03555 [Kiritimatiellota bacterium B12222]|nr:hypothetical protein P3T73_03555 [Kiritimatiellota bacterium B12222]